MLLLRPVAPGADAEVPLTEGRHLVGRGEDCGVRLDDARVSRHHAEVEVCGAHVTARDLSSRNGLFVNRVKVAVAPLTPGDRVAFGPREFLVAERSDEELGPGASPAAGRIRERGRLVGEALPTDSRRLQVLCRVAGELAANLRLAELLPRVLDALAELFRYDRCAIVRCGPGGTLIPWAARPERLEVPFSRSVAERVVGLGEALLFDDVQGQASFDLGESVVGLNIRSVLCSPLAARGEILGLVYLDRSVPGAYDAEDLALLRGMSSMVTVAAENALLYAEVEGRYEESVERLRTLEARLLETERAAALCQLALTVADEIRNPVTVIGGLARRLRRETTEPAFEASARAIQEEAERLERLTGRMEALVTLPAAAVKAVDLADTVAGTLREVQPLLERGGVALRADGEAEAVVVPHDPELTRVALASVLEHACRNLAPGGALRVRVGRDAEKGLVTVEDERCAGRACSLRGVFEAGAPGEPWSLDLGLALAERAMVAQGGDLLVGGHAGTGLCARLLLPKGKLSDSCSSPPAS